MNSIRPDLDDERGHYCDPGYCARCECEAWCDPATRLCQDCTEECVRPFTAEEEADARREDQDEAYRKGEEKRP